jgi:hypothetical protein
MPFGSHPLAKRGVILAEVEQAKQPITARFSLTGPCGRIFLISSEDWGENVSSIISSGVMRRWM